MVDWDWDYCGLCFVDNTDVGFRNVCNHKRRPQRNYKESKMKNPWIGKGIAIAAVWIGTGWALSTGVSAYIVWGSAFATLFIAEN